MTILLKLRYFLSALIIAYCALTTGVFAKPSKEQITMFVTSLSNQVIDVLKTNENNVSGRKAGFEDIFQKAGDVPKIARFVAGASWKNATEDVQENYVKIYRQYMAYTYASRITQYNNQQVKIGRISDLGSNGFLVNTMLVTPNTNNAMSVIWQLSNNDDILKVTDLRVENISMSLTQRAEFAAYLMVNKNDLGQLANLLQTRLNTLK